MREGSSVQLPEGRPAAAAVRRASACCSSNTPARRHSALASGVWPEAVLAVLAGPRPAGGGGGAGGRGGGGGGGGSGGGGVGGGGGGAGARAGWQDLQRLGADLLVHALGFGLRFGGQTPGAQQALRPGPVAGVG